ncbi:MAG: LysM peptidoglycan-binding domain-containing protein [Flavobacteriia bacterium]|jgi:LysM repeat protein|nr:LysM peptidoglycan-binding domain-containing protein [Flavobacteriia bacterium]
MGIKIKVLLLLGIGWNSFAQDWIPLVDQKGKVYHAVSFKPGMSLVAMLQSTNTPSDTFKLDNPLINDEVVEGAILYFRVERKDQRYLVASGDTPYAIAKKFAIFLDTLYASNPEIRSVPLKVGQQVSIKGGVVRYPSSLFSVPNLTDESTGEPVTEEVYRRFLFEDTVLMYQVRNGESLSMVAKRFLTTPKKLKAYNGLSGNGLKAGMTLKIPLIKDSINPPMGVMPTADKRFKAPLIQPVSNAPFRMPTKKEKTFRIGIFLPLGGDTCQSPLRGMPKVALEFYMGAMLAVDSLNRLGCRGEIRFFDYWSRHESVNKVIASGVISSLDLVLGPLHPAESELLAQHCQSLEVPIVLQLPTLNSTLKENPVAFGIATEMDLQIEQMAALAVKRAPVDQVILFTTKLSADTARENMFVQQFKQMNLGSKRLIVADASMLKALLQSGKPSLIFSVSLDKTKVAEVTTWVKKADLTYKLVGLKEWTDWKEINGNIQQESDFYYFSTGCVDYHDRSLKAVHKRFRSAYQTDFTRYAMLGFDEVLGFGSWLSGCGPNFPYQGVMMHFDYRKTTQKYHSNYGLQRCRFRNFKTEKNANFDE